MTNNMYLRKQRLRQGRTTRPREPHFGTKTLHRKRAASS